MNDENRIQLPFSKSIFLMALFVISFLLPLSPLFQIGLSALVIYISFNLFRFKEQESIQEIRVAQSAFAVPTTSQINPFVASSSEMRVAIAHDIQTPLTKIISQADALIDSDPALAPALENIKANAIYLSHHTSGYFEYFGLRETALCFDRTTDITEVLRNCLIDYLDDFDTYGITYRFDIPDNPIPIRTEADLLDRALISVIQYLFSSIETFKDVRVTLIIRKSDIEINLFIDTDKQTRVALSSWRLFGHQDPSRNSSEGLNHFAIVLANQVILKHDGLLTVNEYASSTLHYQIKLKNFHHLLLNT